MCIHVHVLKGQYRHNQQGMESEYWFYINSVTDNSTPHDKVILLPLLHINPPTISAIFEAARSGHSKLHVCIAVVASDLNTITTEIAG